MSVLAGKNASIKKNGVAVAQATNWKIDPSGDLGEYTSFGDDWKKRAALLREWKGSFDLVLDLANTEQKAIHDALLGTTWTLLTDVKFYVDGTHYYSGSIWIQGFPITAAVNDLVKATTNFVGDGTLSYA